MENPLVSLIVPIYNVEKYLLTCLTSIANQNYKNFEALLIDDGSTDSSSIIANNFCKNDLRFKLYRKENAGLSSARNYGLNLVKGEYVYFIDSDDQVKNTFIEKLLNKVLEHNADLAFCLTEVYSETENKLIKDPYYNTTPIENIFFNRWFDHLHIRKYLFLIQVSAWNKVYKTSFLKNISAKFPLNLCFEDNPFFFRCVLNANKICYVNEELYIYRYNRPGSILTSKKRNFFDFFKIIELVEFELKVNTEIWEIYKRDFLHYKYSSLLFWLNQIDSELKPEFYSLIKKELQSEYLLAIKHVHRRRFKRKLRILNKSNYFFYNLITDPLNLIK